SPIVLIAGGKSKGADFTELGKMIERRVKQLILIGEAADAIATESRATPSVRASTIENALQLAREHAVAGDIVLLSPACASFDMFLSAEERGERFEAAVRELERTALRETADA
ncbi:MAG: UDP-N-acetylmuramoyl-L-alanine--D-glutamate ligase, partial [Candidatus Eremiobacteraeota bacterium]|nr:UDP-N-acetylmuramoyl-L-alanine--D-glutamate ligase [Candidatus Eremiobacteraeota bacterium]